MRIRTIKPQFFVNDELAACDPLARLLFIGLWCAADRDGRLLDRPARLKTEILPYDDVDIEVLLHQLAERDFIRRYEVGGRKLIQVTTFGLHQRITGKEAERRSEYPPPPDGWKPPEKKPRGHAPHTPGQRLYEADLNEHGGEHAAINAGGDRGTAAVAPVDGKGAGEWAEEIYQAYPRKVGKPAALRKIRTALHTLPGPQLLERTQAYAQATAGSDPQFIPHPATWFYQERFNDDPTTWTRQNGPGVQNAGRYNPNAQLAGAEADPYGDLGRTIGAGGVGTAGDFGPGAEPPAEPGGTGGASADGPPFGTGTQNVGRGSEASGDQAPPVPDEPPPE